MSSWIGPRVVGGRYLSGYWRKSYTVVEIIDISMEMTCVWEDGETTVHGTCWDETCDKVVSDPFAYNK